MSNLPPNPEPAPAKGRLKVFLGFASGVGKTYAMLDEALRRRQRGQDVVLGALESHGRKETQDLAAQFESVPGGVDERGESRPDLDTLLKRKPDLVLMDELERAYSSSGPFERRWQEVQALLDAGISVLTTLDVQHLESLNDLVHDITGVQIRNTVPDQLLKEADEVEMVDLTPRALINRLNRGVIFPEEEITPEREKLYREGNLSALRELALREIAEHVDFDVEEYRREKGIAKPWAAHDKVMLCISPTRSSLRLVRRGWRAAQRRHADIVAVCVEDRPASIDPKLRDDFNLVERLGMSIIRLQGNVSEQLVKFARENGITEIVIGHSMRTRLQESIKGSIISTLARELRNIDILVVAAETPTPQHEE